MQSSSAKDARKSSVGAAAVRNATGSVNSVVSNGNGGAISRRPVTAAAIIVPAKKNPPLVSTTAQCHDSNLKYFNGGHAGGALNPEERS